MKKLFFSFLLVSSLLANAQSVQFGPKIGMNLSYVDLQENPLNVRSRMKMNANAGLFLRAKVNKFTIQPEAYYSGNTFSLKSDLAIFSNDATKDTRMVYQYLSVPVLLGYEIAKGVHLQAGPQYSWALNSDRSATIGPNKNNDLGIVGGVRIDMLDFMSLFSLNFRYVYGLKDQTDRTYTLQTAMPYDFRNRSVQVSLTYNFSDYSRWWLKQGKKERKK